MGCTRPCTFKYAQQLLSNNYKNVMHVHVHVLYNVHNVYMYMHSVLPTLVSSALSTPLLTDTELPSSRQKVPLDGISSLLQLHVWVKPNHYSAHSGTELASSPGSPIYSMLHETFKKIGEPGERLGQNLAHTYTLQSTLSTENTTTPTTIYSVH